MITFLLLEIVGILIYIIFFIINFVFLYKSNKYIFHNILCLFIDFTQTNKYSFNNRIDNILTNKIIINYISLLNEFTPKKLEILKTEIFNIDINLMTNKEINKSLISDLKDIENQNYLFKNDINNKKQKKNSLLKNSDKKIRTKTSLPTAFSQKNVILNVKTKKGTVDIHNLNFSNLSKNILQDKDKEKNDFLSNMATKPNNSHISEISQNNNNSSIINLKELNNSIINNDSMSNIKKVNENMMRDKIMNEKTSYNMDSNGNNYCYNNKLTIEKIILHSKVIVIQMIKIIMIVFIVFSVIFIVYYIVKIVLGFIIITKISKLYEDFKVLCKFYNEVIHYWNNMKTLFILPNSEVATDLYNVEKYFTENNDMVLNVISTRIKSYKRINILYNYLYNSNSTEDLINANFCGGQEKCYNLINSSQNILLNGLNSAISIYGKEIENFYRDYLKVKDIISTKEDIKNYFMKDIFTILGLNINHIISNIEEKFFRDFLKDEEEIKNEFYNEIKIFNLTALFYCIVLNLFSLLFVFNYVNKIIAFIETSTMRLVEAISYLKYKIKEKADF